MRFIEELLEDEQVLTNGLVVELEHTVAGQMKMVGPMLRMSETPLEVRLASPALGEHTDDVLASIGYGADEIRTLKESGVTR